MTRSGFARATKKLVLIALGNLLLLEFLSLLAVHSLAIVRPQLRLDLVVERHFATITQQDLARFWSRRHALLGWDIRPFQVIESTNSAGESWSASFGADGAREDPRPHDHTLIATYGNSFTEGAEVNNDETWQFYLEGLLGHDVKNFGVGGYGMGQAFLKLRAHLEEQRVAPITMLVIYTVNLSRAVNDFRPFLKPNTGGKLAFKPSHRYLDGEVRFFPNPDVDRSMALDDLQHLAMELASRDYWMTRSPHVVPKFPYLYQIVKHIPMVIEKVRKKVWAAEDEEFIWTSEEGVQVARHIIEQFRESAVEHGSIPVVLFIPHVNGWENGRKSPPYLEVKNQLLKDAKNDLVIIDIYDAEFDEERFSIRPFKGHPSAYGNGVIAAHVASELKGRGLVE